MDVVLIEKRCTNMREKLTFTRLEITLHRYHHKGASERHVSSCVKFQVVEPGEVSHVYDDATNTLSSAEQLQVQKRRISMSNCWSL